MAIVLKLKKKVEGYVPFKGWKPVTHPHYLPGTQVQVIATRMASGPWKYGDVGEVMYFVPATGQFKNPDYDLYRVRLGDYIGHFYYTELKKV